MTARRAALAAGALAVALALPGLTWGIAPHDEGLMLQWGRRIAAGEWPYRDFWMNYLPGQPLVLAVLGDSLLAWRVLRVLVGAACAVLATIFVARCAGPRWALAAGAGVAGAMAWPLGPGPVPPSLALALGALVAARARPGLAGALAGLALVFRLEVGVAALAGVALAGAGRRGLLVGAGVAAAGLAPFALVAGGAMARDVLGFAGVQDLQRLPLPDPFAEGLDPNKVLERGFPWLLLAGAAAVAVGALRRRAAWPLLPLVAVGAAYLLARADEFHLLPLAPAVAVAAAAARRPWLAVVPAVVLLHGLDRQAGRLLHPPPLAPLADGVRADPQDVAAIRALRAALPPGPVYVAPPRHDRVRVGHSLLYVLLDRRNPTRYDVAQPGVTTTARVQRELARDLRDAAAVVRWVGPEATRTEPNASGRSSGVTIADEAIARGFVRAGRFGDFVLYRSRRPNSREASASTPASQAAT